MAIRSARVGVHGRNDYWECKFEKRDYDLIREAKIEHVKMMISDQAAVNPGVLRNAVEVCKSLIEINPEMDFAVRLDDPNRVNKDGHPSAQEFANTFIPIMKGLHAECPYVVKFEILNEPNLTDGGWGPGADQARDFSIWFLETYNRLKEACPWVSLGFPGLAVGVLEEDLGWAEVCRPAVERADWLGVHCYWQNPTYTERSHMNDRWGLRFKAYHEKFPSKVIEITEFGNSNGYKSQYPVDRAKNAQEHVEYYQELFKYPYINSAASFIMSSRHGPWEEQGFTWRSESGDFWPVVQRVGAMQRPPLVAAVAVPLVAAVAVEERYFPETQRTVKGAFLQAFNRYGLEVCGYPITEQFDEAGVRSQYFEYVAMEEYEPGKIRLKAVSDEVLRARRMVTQMQREVRELHEQAAVYQETIIQLRRQVDMLRQQLLAITTTTPGPTPPTPPLPVARPQIEDVTARLPHHPVKSFDSRTLNQIQYLVIQHSVLPGDFPPEKIASYLVEKKQWPGIGYHFYITSDGKIYQTNTLETVCYFAGSNVQYNPLGVCICFAGDFTSEVPTAAQLSSGGKLLAFLMQELQLPVESIRGQKEFVATQSPGQQWDGGRKWRDMLLTKVKEAQG